MDTRAVASAQLKTSWDHLMPSVRRAPMPDLTRHAISSLRTSPPTPPYSPSLSHNRLLPIHPVSRPSSHVAPQSLPAKDIRIAPATSADVADARHLENPVSLRCTPRARTLAGPDQVSVKKGYYYVGSFEIFLCVFPFYFYIKPSLSIS